MLVVEGIENGLSVLFACALGLQRTVDAASWTGVEGGVSLDGL